jgi:hypothetical protein
MAYIAPNLRMSPLLGLGATYNDDTPCGAIPAGDPYRSPGHWCMYAGQMLQFDDKGQVHPDPVSGATTVGPPASTVDSIVSKVPGGSTTLLIAAAGLGAWLMFGGKKKGRR